jgi:hypothetical protein
VTLEAGIVMLAGGTMNTMFSSENVKNADDVTFKRRMTMLDAAVLW